MLVTLLVAKLLGQSIVDDSVLNADEKAFAAEFSIYRALSPWILLILLAAVTNVDPLYSYLFKDLSLPINIGNKIVDGTAVPAIIVKTMVFWQAYL